MGEKDVQTTIACLEAEWERSSGFLGLLRTGVFDPEGFGRLVQILESVDTGECTTLDRRFVSLTWYIPMFMSWQQERVRECGGSIEKLNAATNEILGLIESILGIP
jgi:hypothetical protein